MSRESEDSAPKETYKLSQGIFQPSIEGEAALNHPLQGLPLKYVDAILTHVSRFNEPLISNSVNPGSKYFLETQTAEPKPKSCSANTGPLGLVSYLATHSKTPKHKQAKMQLKIDADITAGIIAKLPLFLSRNAIGALEQIHRLKIISHHQTDSHLTLTLKLSFDDEAPPTILIAETTLSNDLHEFSKPNFEILHQDRQIYYVLGNPRTHTYYCADLDLKLITYPTEEFDPKLEETPQGILSKHDKKAVLAKQGSSLSFHSASSRSSDDLLLSPEREESQEEGNISIRTASVNETLNEACGFSLTRHNADQDNPEATEIRDPQPEELSATKSTTMIKKHKSSFPLYVFDTDRRFYFLMNRLELCCLIYAFRHRERRLHVRINTLWCLPTIPLHKLGDDELIRQLLSPPGLSAPPTPTATKSQESKSQEKGRARRRSSEGFTIPPSIIETSPATDGQAPPILDLPPTARGFPSPTAATTAQQSIHLSRNDLLSLSPNGLPYSPSAIRNLWGPEVPETQGQTLYDALEATLAAPNQQDDASSLNTATSIDSKNLLVPPPLTPRTDSNQSLGRNLLTPRYSFNYPSGYQAKRFSEDFHRGLNHYLSGNLNYAKLSFEKLRASLIETLQSFTALLESLLPFCFEETELKKLELQYVWHYYIRTLAELGELELALTLSKAYLRSYPKDLKSQVNHQQISDQYQPCSAAVFSATEKLQTSEGSDTKSAHIAEDCRLGGFSS